MDPTPKGKIGCLPKALQEEVNRRLENNKKGRSIIAWLNSLPEVQQVLAEQFRGVPVSEVNLSQWRARGYKAWLWRRGPQAPVPQTDPLPAADEPPLTDQMASWVTVRYLMAIRKLVDKNAGGEPDLKTLRAFLHDVVAVRRGDLVAARLKLVQDRLERISFLHKPKPECSQPNCPHSAHQITTRNCE